MSRERLVFDVSDNPVVEVATFTGDVGIDIGDADSIVVECDTGERGYTVEQVGSRVVVAPRPGRFRRFGAGDLNLVVPAGTDVMLRTTSGDVRSGHSPRDAGLGRVELSTASGDARLGVVGSLSAKTASGDLFVDEVRGDLTAGTASGDVRIDRVDGDVQMSTAAGDGHFDVVTGDVVFRTASGDLNIGRLEGSSLRGKTLAGDLRIGIPPRREIALDLNALSGDLHHDLTASGETPLKRLRIEISSVSGDVFLYDA